MGPDLGPSPGYLLSLCSCGGVRVWEGPSSIQPSSPPPPLSPTRREALSSREICSTLSAYFRLCSAVFLTDKILPVCQRAANAGALTFYQKIPFESRNENKTKKREGMQGGLVEGSLRIYYTIVDLIESLGTDRKSVV